MHFYIAIEGEKRGPYSAFRIIDQLRGGEVSPDVLGWEPGMDAWLKLREIPAFADSIEAMEKEPAPEADEEKSAKTGPKKKIVVSDATAPKTTPVVPELISTDQRRPFIRFWARMFDYTLVSTAAWQVCEVPPQLENITLLELFANDGTIIPQETLLDIVKVYFAFMLIWQFIEGALIHTFGTTPGKALFNIRVTSADGSLLPLIKGFGRSFFVWVVGFGMGLFPFILIGMSIGIAMLQFAGSTLWDRQLESRVHHGPMTPPRILMAVGGFFLLMMISSLKFS
ncbi:MAG: RDD family protein [Verrucomicrobiae bacterium]|nr:RDD family protein [Verrucomicrobiae bacterium]